MKDPHNMRTLAFFSFCVLVMGLSGCTGFNQTPQLDPFSRPGDWSMTGAANETIAQQAANPSDLIRGQSDALAPGSVAVAAVNKATATGSAAATIGLQTPAVATSTVTSISTGN